MNLELLFVKISIIKQKLFKFAKLYSIIEINFIYNGWIYLIHVFLYVYY